MPLNIAGGLGNQALVWGYQIAYIIGTVAVFAIVGAVIWLIRRKMVHYTVKVTIYQPRNDGWKKFYTKGAFVVDRETNLEYFRIKGRKNVMYRAPVLNAIAKGNEAEFIEPEVGILVPIMTEIKMIATEVPRYDKQGNIIYKPELVDKLDEFGNVMLDENKKPIQIQLPETEIQYQAKKVVDPDYKNTEGYIAALRVQSKRAFSVVDWLTEHAQAIGLFSIMIVLIFVMIIFWQTFSHPIVIQVSGGEVISGVGAAA